MSALKKRYERLAAENTSLKDAVAAHSGTDDLEETPAPEQKCRECASGIVEDR